MKIIKIITDSPLEDNIIVWTITEVTPALEEKDIVAIGTANSLQEAAVAAIQRYREME